MSDLDIFDDVVDRLPTAPHKAVGVAVRVFACAAVAYGLSDEQIVSLVQREVALVRKAEAEA